MHAAVSQSVRGAVGAGIQLLVHGMVRNIYRTPHTAQSKGETGGGCWLLPNCVLVPAHFPPAVGASLVADADSSV